jgi:hypothetical protein
MTEPDYKALYMELNSAITWDQTCLNCASLLDKNYEYYATLEQIADEIRGSGPFTAYDGYLSTSTPDRLRILYLLHTAGIDGRNKREKQFDALSETITLGDDDE